MSFSRELLEGVRKAYSAAAERPGDQHPFPVGRRFAESLSYPRELLDSLPSIASDAFTGVSNVSVFADIPAGSTVLDLGCGAGLDLLIAARRTGIEGKVIGVDFSEAMLSRSRKAILESGLNNVEVRLSNAEQLPVADSSIDVVLVNGIFNLNPSRELIFRELARVVRHGGTVYAAELILIDSFIPEVSLEPANWFA